MIPILWFSKYIYWLHAICAKLRETDVDAALYCRFRQSRPTTGPSLVLRSRSWCTGLLPRQQICPNQQHWLLKKETRSITLWCVLAPCCAVLAPCCAVLAPCCAVLAPCCDVLAPCCDVLAPCCDVLAVLAPCCAVLNVSGLRCGLVKRADQTLYTARSCK